MQLSLGIISITTNINTLKQTGTKILTCECNQETRLNRVNHLFIVLFLRLFPADIIGISSLSSSTPGCDFVASYNSPTMFPGPTLSAGMYSKSHGGYIQEVSSMQWLKVLYPNESMSYSFKNFTYTVSFTFMAS